MYLRTGSILLLLVVFVGHVVSDPEEATCSEGVAKPQSVILRRKLLCNYDKNVRPVVDVKTATNVSISIYLKFIYFHEKWNMLKLHSWTSWGWRDEFLTWNKTELTEYEGNNPILRVNSDDIWVPDFQVFTAANMASLKPPLENRKCVVKNDGSVQFFGPTVNSALCYADVTRWPFDVQNCTMIIGSWTYAADQINLTIGSKGISTFRFVPNRDWDLLSTKGFVDVNKYGTNTTYHTAHFNLVLRRHSGFHAAFVFIPSLVLSTLTLVSFWLDPGSKERLFLIYINILCHYVYLQHLGVTLLPNGDKYPLILLFFRDSLLIVVVTLIITLLVRRMDAAPSKPPVWITAVTNGLLASLPDSIIIIIGLDMKSGATEEESQIGGGVAASAGWRRFATLVDRVLFIAFFIALVVLLTAFLP